MKSQLHKMIIYFILMLCIVIVTPTKQVQVPVMVQKTPIVIKAGTYHIIQQPKFQFQRVYRKTVEQRDGNHSYRFAPCVENKAQVQLMVDEQIKLQGVPLRPSVIYDFHNIQYSQFLLDMYLDRGITVYIIFKNHKIAVIDLPTKRKSIFSIQGVDQDVFLQLGYFIKVNQNILFVNPSFVIKLEYNQAVVVENFKQKISFQTAIALYEDYFAVVQGPRGFTIYEYNNGNITHIKQFNIIQLAPTYRVLEIRDLLYWNQMQTIILLDQMEGIRTFKLTQTNGTFSLMATQVITTTRGCKLMYMSKKNLYAFCNAVYNFNLINWPRVVENKISTPSIGIRQIYQIGDILAFVGRNSFTLSYLNRLVNNFEEKGLDKVMFYNNMFINADQEEIMIGRFKLIKPYISCQNTEDLFMRETALEFKTKAQCNPEFFKSHNITLSEEVTKNDICIYTVHRSIVFWKPGEILYIPFLIAGILVICLGIGIWVVYFIKRRRLKEYIDVLQQYSIQGVSDSAKQHNVDGELEMVGTNNVLKQSQSGKNSGKDQRQIEKQKNKKPKQTIQVIQNSENEQKQSEKHLPESRQ